jgi:hypothetical protein
MRVSIARVAAIALLTFGAAGASVPAHAESAMAACGAQWKQAKAAGTTGGATWPEFLKQCRTQTAAAPASAPAATPAAAPASSGALFPWANPEPAPTATASNQSVMAACGAQWKQAKAAGTTGGAIWPQFLKQCRAQTASASPAPTPTAAPAPAPAPAPASQSSGSLFPWMNPSSNNAAPGAAPTGAGQFSTDAEARYRCPTDKVVWVNNESHIYHYQSGRYYGRTKKGAYMCEADAKASGARASKSREAQREPM